MKYVKGDATQPEGKGNKIIAHITNTYNGKWEKGFVGAIKARFGDEPGDQYQRYKIYKIIDKKIKTCT